MRRLSAFILHVTAAGIMVWGWFSLAEPVVQFIRSQKGGHFQFLTNHGLVFAWLYMVVSMFCDVLPSATVAHRFKRMLLMLSLPVAFVISTIYWSLLVFFPDLITLSTAGFRLPLPVDLALHASPLFTLLVDFFVFESKFSKAYVHKAAPAVLLAFSVWYASFVEYCAPFNGSFPYPFLTYSSFPIRVLIYAMGAGMALGCFKTLNILHV